MSKRWTEKEDNILIANYYNKGVYGCMKLINLRDYWGILNRARKLKLKSNLSITHKHIFYNEDFFSEPNIQNSYWAGLLAADGNIDIKNKCVSIKLTFGDIDILENFKKQTNYSSNIKIYKEHKFFCKNKQRWYNRKATCELNFCYAVKWINDLNNFFNLTPKKSLTLQPPNITDNNYILAFIIGLIDGDGCVSADKNKSPRLSICGTKDLLTWVKSKIEQILNIKIVQKVVKVKTNLYNLRFNTTDTKGIIKISKSINVPYILERKWSKFYI